MSLPEKIELDPKDADALKDLSLRQKAVGQFVQTVTEQGEKRLYELQRDTSAFWSMAKDKYKLDLENVNYTLDNDDKHIIPISMKLV